jgi:hypothetical protein
LGETGLAVRLSDVSLGTDFGEAGVTGTTFSKAITLNATGTHQLRARATDAAGNVSSNALLDVFVDATQPTVSITLVVPNPRPSPVSSIDITFSEALNAATLSTADLMLTRDGGANLINGGVTLSPLGGHSYQAGGLNALTAVAGNYLFTVKATGVEDTAGNAGLADVNLTIQITGSTPVVDVGADATLAEGDTFSRAGSFVDPDADSWSATVNYGDGSGDQALSLAGDKTFNLSHLFADNGVFTVTVTVNDGGSSGNDALTLTVTNIAPTVVVKTNAMLNAGNGFCRSGLFADPGADTWNATVDYGAGAGPQALTLAPDHSFVLGAVYAGSGPHTVTVTVTDDDGGVGNAEIVVVDYDSGRGDPFGGGAPPQILSIEFDGDDTVLVVPTVTGFTAQLEYTDDIVSDTWHPVGAIEDGDCGAMTFTDPGGRLHPGRLYHIRLTAP